VIAASRRRDAQRDVAVARLQLGSVRLLQHDYPKALDEYETALGIVSEIDDPEMVATAWHQIGMLHRQYDKPKEAENAYKQSLGFRFRSGNRAAEASALGELGNLYAATGQAEYAVNFFRQAAAKYADPQVADLISEGVVHSNAGAALLQLGRLVESRSELLRALECKKPFGHAAEPWNTLDLLSELELAEGGSEAAALARRQAIAAYLAYRRDGGENQSGRPTAGLCTEIAQMIANGLREEAVNGLAKRRKMPDVPPDAYPFFDALATVVAGSRDPALADNPALDYRDAAELLLLLEHLWCERRSRWLSMAESLFVEPWTAIPDHTSPPASAHRR